MIKHTIGDFLIGTINPNDGWLYRNAQRFPHDCGNPECPGYRLNLAWHRLRALMEQASASGTSAPAEEIREVLNTINSLEGGIRVP